MLGPVPEDPGLLPASKARDIPWDAIGAGWLLFDFVAAFDLEIGDWEDAPRVLYLQDPDGDRYTVGGWLTPWNRVLDWSVATHRVLALHPVESGEDYLGEELWLLDLRSGEKVVLLGPSPDRWLSAQFVRPDGDRIVVRIAEEGSARLVFADAGGTQLSELAETSWDPDDYVDPHSVRGGITWAPWPVPSGIVVADRDGIRVVSYEGETVRELETPGLGCELTRNWGGAVLASCLNPAYVTSPCWGMWGSDGHRELWSVWTGGRDAHPVYRPPLPDPETCDGYDPYCDALFASESSEATLLLTRGCCECGSRLELLDESGSRQVDLGEVEICSPELIGAAAHGDGFIVLDWQTRPEGRFGVLLEVDLDGTLAGFVTPWLDGMGGVTGAWPAE